MRILVVGATGVIGKAVVAALQSAGHEVIAAHRNSGSCPVDITDPESIRQMYRSVGKVDAVVSAAGDAKFQPLEQLADADIQFSLKNKLMGQVNLVRFGLNAVRDGGSFTLTSGILAREPMPGGAAISMVNGGLEAFVRAAALEAPRGIRINIISPPWVTETLKMLGMDTSHGLPAATVAKSYVESVTSTRTGVVIELSK